MSGTACLKIVYAYVHWVLIQAVPFAFFIDLALFDKKQKTTVREFVERTFDEYLFEVYL